MTDNPIIQSTDDLEDSGEIVEGQNPDLENDAIEEKNDASEGGEVSRCADGGEPERSFDVDAGEDWGDAQVSAKEVNEVDGDEPDAEELDAEEPTADESDVNESSEPEAVEVDSQEVLAEAIDQADEPVSADAVAQSDQDEESDDDLDDMADEPEGEIEVTMEGVVEAILFACDEPLTPLRLAKIAETEARQVKGHVKSLNAKYRANGNSFRIEKVAGGFQMMTLGVFSGWLSKLIKVRDDGKLSPAALETLAIVAYKQPIIRADVEAIRGVAAGEMIRNLMYKGLVKIVGRAEILGRPMQYGTTKKFLEVFGLNSLRDLPKIEELKKPS